MEGGTESSPGADPEWKRVPGRQRNKKEGADVLKEPDSMKGTVHSAWLLEEPGS